MVLSNENRQVPSAQICSLQSLYSSKVVMVFMASLMWITELLHLSFISLSDVIVCTRNEQELEVPARN
jgi:hypothetical protein